jgi:hypothetical protein
MTENKPQNSLPKGFSLNIPTKAIGGSKVPALAMGNL